KEIGGIQKEFQESGERAEAPFEGEERTPVPVQTSHQSFSFRNKGKTTLSSKFSFFEGKEAVFEVKHRKRESGCIPLGTNRYAQWGWYYEDEVAHRVSRKLSSF